MHKKKLLPKSNTPTPDIAFSYAAGKIILAGEHAVVYGHPAVAAALDRGMRIAATLNPKSTSLAPGPVLKATGLGFEGQVRPDPHGEGPAPLRLALERLVDLCGGERVRRLELIVDSHICGGRGLGSSAALSVGLIRGVHRYFGETLSADKVAGLAFELEKIFHGNPSGLDHTVIAQGGMIFYQIPPGGKPLIKPLKTPAPLKFAIGLTPPHRGTSKIVTEVKRRLSRQPELYTHTFEGISLVAQKMAQALEKGHLAEVGELMDLCQGFLNALSLSTPEIELLCDLAKKQGALGAKLTGAGGGGAVIALSEGDPSPIVQAFTHAGYLSFAVCTQT